MSRGLEPVATGCNILSNAVVLRSLCDDPNAPMPRTGLALQMCANLFWFTHATARGDVFLATTAVASALLQACSLVLRRRVAEPE